MSLSVWEPVPSDYKLDIVQEYWKKVTQNTIVFAHFTLSNNELKATLSVELW